MSNNDNQQDDDMNCGLTVDEYRCLRRELGNLPDTPPERRVWSRIQDQARAEGLIDRPRFTRETRWFAGTGIAAAVVLAVLGVPLDRDVGVETLAGQDEFPTEPRFDPQQQQFDSINALMVQSQLLEQDLRQLPEQPELARADTLATIDELESRIAAIDYQLSDPDADLTREEQEMYWQERVRMLDSLIQLRYAQSQRLWF